MTTPCFDDEIGAAEALGFAVRLSMSHLLDQALGGGAGFTETKPRSLGARPHPRRAIDTTARPWQNCPPEADESGSPHGSALPQVQDAFLKELTRI